MIDRTRNVSDERAIQRSQSSSWRYQKLSNKTQYLIIVNDQEMSEEQTGSLGPDISSFLTRPKNPFHPRPHPGHLHPEIDRRTSAAESTVRHRQPVRSCAPLLDQAKRSLNPVPRPGNSKAATTPLCTIFRYESPPAINTEERNQIETALVTGTIRISRNEIATKTGHSIYYYYYSC